MQGCERVPAAAHVLFLGLGAASWVCPAVNIHELDLRGLGFSLCMLSSSQNMAGGGGESEKSLSRRIPLTEPPKGNVNFKNNGDGMTPSILSSLAPSMFGSHFCLNTCAHTLYMATHVRAILLESYCLFSTLQDALTSGALPAQGGTAHAQSLLLHQAFPF